MDKIGTRYDGMAEAFTIERMLVPKSTISQDNFGAVPYEYQMQRGLHDKEDYGAGAIDALKKM